MEGQTSMSKIKVSIVVSCFATEHLMSRSIETWANQDFPKDEWELIVINDCALGDVKGIIEPYRDRINMQYIEFNHTVGMRGNTIALNTGWMCARGRFCGESTPETMWPTNLVRLLHDFHEDKTNRFIMFKTYNLTHDMQLKIDSVDWKADIMNISKIDGWNSDWVQANKNKGDDWGTHQTDSILKKTWYEITEGYGWPLYSGYGEDDPYCSGLREQKNIEDCVVLEPMCIHQHHLPFDYFASLGHAPNLNKHNHTIYNIWNDVSGRVPEYGTCAIFDGRDESKMTEEAIANWRQWDDYFLKSGGDPKYLEPRFDYYKKYGY
jgi:glycosyltransferase involved in cell wall biosynthesis